jgi:hypothetical protein
MYIIRIYISNTNIIVHIKGLYKVYTLWRGNRRPPGKTTEEGEEGFQ